MCVYIHSNINWNTIIVINLGYKAGVIFDKTLMSVWINVGRPLYLLPISLFARVLDGGALLYTPVATHPLLQRLLLLQSAVWSRIVQQSSGMALTALRAGLVCALSVVLSCLPCLPPRPHLPLGLHSETERVCAAALVCVSALITHTGSATPPWPESIPSPSLCNPFIRRRDGDCVSVRVSVRACLCVAVLNLHCPASVVCIMQSTLEV